MYKLSSDVNDFQNSLYNNQKRIKLSTMKSQKPKLYKQNKKKYIN